jgi:hypothetical protein
LSISLERGEMSIRYRYNDGTKHKKQCTMSDAMSFAPDVLWRFPSSSYNRSWVVLMMAQFLMMGYDVRHSFLFIKVEKNTTAGEEKSQS